MRLHLNEWMMPNKASNNLLRIWNDENSKDKIVDASVEYVKNGKVVVKLENLIKKSKRELLIISSISDFREN